MSKIIDRIFEMIQNEQISVYKPLKSSINVVKLLWEGYEANLDLKEAFQMFWSILRPLVACISSKII